MILQDKVAIVTGAGSGLGRAFALGLARERGRPVENKGVGIWIRDPNVDFAGLARSYGLYGEGPIEDPDEIRPALQRALRVVKEERRLALVDVVTQAR